MVAVVATVSLELTAISTARSAIAVSPNAQLPSNSILLTNNSFSTLKAADYKSKDNLTKIIFLASLVGIGTLSWQISRSRRGAKFSRFKPIKSNSDTALLDRVSPKLRRQLLRLVNDPKTVNRLLLGIYKTNCDRSPNWIAEKAIYDLRRGR